MHVLHIFDHSLPLHSGYAFRSAAILDRQRALGLQTSQITSIKHNLDHVPAPVEAAGGIEFHRTAPSGALHKYPLVDQWLTIHTLERRLRELIAELRPDVLQAHSPALVGVAAVRAAHRAGLPVVYEVRGFWEDAGVSHGKGREGDLRYRLTRGMETWVARRADALTCICAGIRDDLVGRGIAAEKITIVPNAVDALRFREIAARETELAARLGLEGRKVVGFIGSFYEYEGLDLLLDALPALLEADPDIRLLLVGGGQAEAKLRARAAATGLDPYVVFAGRVPHEEVERYYSLIDILAYPRHPMRLTELVTPLKPLEAMAQQRLFVASDVGGHRELVRDGETGVLFRAGDSADLARVIRELFENRARWPEIQAAGRRFVEDERTWERSVANYLPVYEGLVRH